MAIAKDVRCSHCGGPVEFEPGEIIVTCKYCGFTTVIETGNPFNFEHSLLLNEYNLTQVDDLIKSWMRQGFMMPNDLAGKSKIFERNLVYLPFWVISIEAKTSYKGIFDRITPPIVKTGKIQKEYNWLVLAREAAGFPTREYNIPLEGKIPYDFRKIERFAKVLNSEIDKDEAIDIAKQQIEAHHRYLLKQDIDRVVEMHTEINYKQAVYLHAPVWFFKYEYRGKAYEIILDGASGMTLKGDIPSPRF